MPDPIPTATDPKLTSVISSMDTYASTKGNNRPSGILNALTVSHKSQDAFNDPYSLFSDLLELEKPDESELPPSPSETHKLSSESDKSSDKQPLSGADDSEDTPPLLGPNIFSQSPESKSDLLKKIESEEDLTKLLQYTQEVIATGDIDMLLAVVSQIGIRLSKMEKENSFIEANCSNKEIEHAREANKAVQEAMNEKKAQARRCQQVMKALMWAGAILGALVAIVALVAAIFTGGASILLLIGAIVGVVASIASIAVMAVRESGTKVPDWVDYIIMGVGLAGALVSIGPSLARGVALLVQKLSAKLGAKFLSMIPNLAVKATSSTLRLVCTRLVAFGTGMQGLLQIANGAAAIAKGKMDADLLTQQAMSKFQKGKLDQLQMILQWITQALDQVNENYKKICDLLSSYLKNEADVLAGSQQNLA